MKSCASGFSPAHCRGRILRGRELGEVRGGVGVEALHGGGLAELPMWGPRRRRIRSNSGPGQVAAGDEGWSATTPGPGGGDRVRRALAQVGAAPRRADAGGAALERLGEPAPSIRSMRSSSRAGEPEEGRVRRRPRRVVVETADGRAGSGRRRWWRRRRRARSSSGSLSCSVTGHPMFFSMLPPSDPIARDAPAARRRSPVRQERRES
jgi:hypothetical protein